MEELDSEKKNADIGRSILQIVRLLSDYFSRTKKQYAVVISRSGDEKCFCVYAGKIVDRELCGSFGFLKMEFQEGRWGIAEERGLVGLLERLRVTVNRDCADK